MVLPIPPPIAALAPYNLPAQYAANLLQYQTSFLRLCAAAAPKPWFQYQSSVLRIWAEYCQITARNLENGFASPSLGIELAQATSEQRSDDEGSLSSKQDNDPIIDRPNDAAAEAAARKWAPKKTAVAADVSKAAAPNRKPANTARRAATAGKRTAKKIAKAPAKTASRVRNAAARTKVSRKTLKFSKASRRRKGGKNGP
jgi:hypothetical protein